MMRRSAYGACGDATPSNKPLEWTGPQEFTSGTRYSWPATQGQRWPVPVRGALRGRLELLLSGTGFFHGKTV